MPSRGPLTPEELFELIKSTSDYEYLRPFIEQGDGSGLELFTALCEVLARAGEAVDATTQGLFVLPWSGQSGPPAAGPSRTQLRLLFERTRRLDVPLTLLAGTVLYEELATDWGPDGGVEVSTGRRYTLVSDFTFLPGQAGPVLIDAISNRDGFGYANPELESITGIVQPGSGFSNIEASVAQSSTSARLVVAPDSDVVTPSHVGQYIELSSGSNAGAVRLMYGYERPDVNIPHGGVAVLAPIFAIRGTYFTGDFTIGEVVSQYDTSVPPVVVAQGRLRAATPSTDGSPWYLVLETMSGEFQVSDGVSYGGIIGNSSGAEFTLVDFDAFAAFADTLLVDEVETAVWRVLDWADDFGLTVTNPEEATPGDVAMLDAIGAERKIPRAPGESDDSYRKRVAEIADTVSPNAIVRTGNRIWAPLGGSVCLREVGSEKLPGLYFDGDADYAAYSSFDLDGLTFAGVKFGFFADGEVVAQENDGQWTFGRVTSTISDPVTAWPYSPMPPPIPSLARLEVAGIYGPGFQTGLPMVGEETGAIFMPTVLLEGGLRPQDRYNLLFDYTEFRAFFLLGVPPSGLGEFGTAFDEGASNAFDAAPYDAFWDGYPLEASKLYRATYQAIDEVKAGGVGFDLYLETSGCA